MGKCTLKERARSRFVRAGVNARARALTMADASAETKEPTKTEFGGTELKSSDLRVPPRVGQEKSDSADFSEITCSSDPPDRVHELRRSVLVSNQIAAEREEIAYHFQALEDGGPENETSTSCRERTKQPSDEELEEFFAGADRVCAEAQRKMSEKYNFDFERCVPLEGRLEWFAVSERR